MCLRRVLIKFNSASSPAIRSSSALILGLSVSQLLHLPVNPSAPCAYTSCYRYDSGCYYYNGHRVRLSL
jgi:hypothetical protein